MRPDYDADADFERLKREGKVDPNWPTPSEGAEAIQAMGDIVFKMTPQQGLELAGLIQLAMRHPQMAEDSISNTAVRVVQAIRDSFRASPALQMVIDAGWTELSLDDELQEGDSN